MKKTLFLLLIFSCIQFSFSQKTWQEATIIADSLSFENQLKKAINFREKAINLAKNESENTKEMLSLFKGFSNSELYFIDKKTHEKGYEEVKNYMVKLENLKIDKNLLYPRYRRLYVYAHDYFFNLIDAENYTALSLNILNNNKIKDTLKLCDAYHYSAIAKRELGKLSNAASHFKMAIKLMSNYSKIDSNSVANYHTDYADVYRKKFLNLPIKHYQLLKKAEEIYTKVKKPNLMYFSGVYIRLGDLEKQIGNYKNAVGYLNKNHKIFNKDKNTSTKYDARQMNFVKELQYYHFLVGIHSKDNNEKEMLAALNSMIKINTENKLSVMELAFLSIAYQSAGNYYYKKNPSEALKLYKKGLTYNPKFPTLDFEPDFNIEIARTFIETKKYTKAISKLKKAEKNPTIIFQVKIDAYKLLAISYLNTNDTINSFKYINKLINLISTNKEKDIDLKNFKLTQYKPSNSLADANNFVAIAEALSLKGKMYSEEVFNLYKIALIHFENNFQKDFVNPKLNKLYKRIINGIYSSIFKEKNNSELAKKYLASFENIESKLLLNSFIQNRAISGKDNVNNTLLKEQEIRANITYLKKSILKENNKETKQNLFEEEEKLKTLLESNTNNFNLPTFTFNDFLSNNKKNILKYKKVGEHLYILSFVGSDFKITKITNFNTVKEKVELLNTYLTNPNASINDIKNIGSDLFKLLIPKEFSTKKTITIIPDDILYYLPFELLQNKDTYLIDKISINYVSSLSFLNSKINKNSKNNKIALFLPIYNFENKDTQLVVRGETYKLKGAEEEINAISKIYTNSDLFIGNKASKESFIQLKNNYAILHLAMHSVLNDEDSELSTLLFSGNSKLHIAELYGLKLNADLAVLSACNTGVGKLRDGKGIVAMNSAFTYAGVPSTVSSLWSAPDQSTKEIMIDFYKNLKQKHSISESLRNAKLNYLSKTDDAQLKHPYYWAGFVMYGNDSVINLTNNNGSYLKWIGIIVFILLVFFGVKKYKS